MYYNNFLHPPVLAKYNEHGHKRIVRYIDKSECELHRHRYNFSLNNFEIPISINNHTMLLFLKICTFVYMYVLICE